MIPTTSSPGKRRYRPRTIWASVVVVVFLVGGCSSSPAEPDESVVDFHADIEMFPAPPVDDAEVMFGFVDPEEWQWRPDACFSPGLESLLGRRVSDPWKDVPDVYRVAARDWQGVRYDWSDQGLPRSWVIIEQTIGFADGEQRDRYLNDVGNAVNECGDDYGDVFNASNLPVTQLPDGAVAYTSQRDPEWENETPVERRQRVRTALIPGEHPNLLIVVRWSAFGTDVPADQFESAAATLATHANAAVEAQSGAGE